MMKRCPWCGQGRLFERWLKLPERCPRCGFRFEREEGAFLGSMALNFGVTSLLFIAVLVGWVAMTLPDVPLAPLFAVSVAITGITPLLFYPFSKTIWAAIDVVLHSMDPVDREGLAATFGVRGGSSPGS